MVLKCGLEIAQHWTWPVSQRSYVNSQVNVPASAQLPQRSDRWDQTLCSAAMVQVVQENLRVSPFSWLLERFDCRQIY